MQRRTVHQWRDWVLEYIGDNSYELVQKETLTVTTLTAKDYMDAETQSQLIIKNAKQERT
jgi:phage FluMu protein gp41